MEKFKAVNGLFYRRFRVKNEVEVELECYVDDCVVAIDAKDANGLFLKLSDMVKTKPRKDGSHGWTEASRFLGVEYQTFQNVENRGIEVNMDKYTEHFLTTYEATFGSLKKTDRLTEVSSPVPERSTFGHQYMSPVASALWLV